MTTFLINWIHLHLVSETKVQGFSANITGKFVNFGIYKLNSGSEGTLGILLSIENLELRLVCSFCMQIQKNLTS
jgi:hypothetical protein